MNSYAECFPQAIFFDFDGVIIDSTLVKTEGFRSLFARYDTKIIQEILEYHKLKGGISRVEKIIYAHEKIIREPLSTLELERLAGAYSNLVLEKVIHAPWIPGAQKFLQSQSGDLPIFVISGTPEEELKMIIRRRAMTHYFHEILGSPVNKKEHILMLLKKYSLDPQLCVFVGDAMTDYEAAKETGLQFIGIRGENTFPEGTKVLPDCRELHQAIAELKLPGST